MEILVVALVVVILFPLQLHVYCDTLAVVYCFQGKICHVLPITHYVFKSVNNVHVTHVVSGDNKADQASRHSFRMQHHWTHGQWDPGAWHEETKAHAKQLRNQLSCLSRGAVRYARVRSELFYPLICP